MTHPVRVRMVIGPWVHSKYGLLTKQRGLICAAGAFKGGGGGGTLALTSLASSHTVFTGQATAGVRMHTDGNVYELVSGTNWFAQNSSTEWIDTLVGDAASNYETQMDTGTLFGQVTLSGTVGSYLPMTLIRQWTITAQQFDSGTYTSTLRVREIANTANNASASVFLSADAGGI